MIKKISLGLVAMTALTGCGASDDSDSSTPAAKTFDLSAYTEAVNTSDSLTGTWVMVQSGSSTTSDDDFGTLTTNQSGKKYFVIKEENNSYSSSTCSFGGFTSAIVSPTEDTIQISEIGTAEINSYTSLSGTRNLSESVSNATNSTVSFEIIKISESTEAIGSLNMTGEKDINNELYCFHEESFGARAGEYSGTGSVFFAATEYADLEVHTSTGDGAYNSLEVGGFYWDTDNDDSVRISFQSSDSFNSILSVSASGYEGNISGTLTIQLPRQ